jgi:FtsZ-binding cell division protein ZapB
MADETTETVDTTEDIEIKNPKAVLAALERAKADAQKFREELEAMKADYEALQKTNEALQTTVKTYEEGGNEWQNRAKELMVKQAIGTRNPERIMKFMDMDSIAFDEHGQLTGFDEAFGKVKNELPELFNEKKRVGGAADLFAKDEVQAKQTGTEAQVARIFRKG